MRYSALTSLQMEELYDTLAQAKELRLTAAILATDASKVKEVWRLRETIAEGLKAAKSSATYKYQYMYGYEHTRKPVAVGLTPSLCCLHQLLVTAHQSV